MARKRFSRYAQRIVELEAKIRAEMKQLIADEDWYDGQRVAYKQVLAWLEGGDDATR